MNGEADCSLSRVSFGSFSDLDAARVKVRFMPLNGQGRREAKTHAWLLWAYCRLVDLMDERLRVERWTSALETLEAKRWIDPAINIESTDAVGRLPRNFTLSISTRAPCRCQ
jgi:hypothetical protein